MATGIQLSGFLYKLPFGHQSTKWSKRFFILKDGFMLYYHDSEKKEYEKGKGFNIHPKGAVPLDGSDIQSAPEQGHPFAIHIKNDYYQASPIIIAAESEVERDKWLIMLRRSSRVTWDNAELGDSMIRQLEAQGLQMAKEKQVYFDQLQSEAKALHDEQCKTEELEKMKEELEKEKIKMEMMAKEVTDQYRSVKMELEETSSRLQDVEIDKRELHEQTEALQLNLQDLNAERENTVLELQRHQSEAMKLSKENENLNEVTDSLKRNLKLIEDKSHRIIEEKKKTEGLLLENKSKEDDLLYEKTLISERVTELENSIKDLTEQKAITEAELKEEVVARLDAERRLKEAEQSLSRLERAVRMQGEDDRDEEIVKEEMLGDVKTLKRFFENLAFEAHIDSEKSVMIKNSIHARKTLVRRAKTMRYQASRSRHTKENGTDKRSSMISTLPANRIHADDCTNNNEEVQLAVRQLSKSTERLSLEF